MSALWRCTCRHSFSILAFAFFVATGHALQQISAPAQHKRSRVLRQHAKIPCAATAREISCVVTTQEISCSAVAQAISRDGATQEVCHNTRDLLSCPACHWSSVNCECSLARHLPPQFFHTCICPCTTADFSACTAQEIRRAATARVISCVVTMHEISCSAAAQEIPGDVMAQH